MTVTIYYIFENYKIMSKKSFIAAPKYLLSIRNITYKKTHISEY